MWARATSHHRSVFRRWSPTPTLWIGKVEIRRCRSSIPFSKRELVSRTRKRPIKRIGQIINSWWRWKGTQAKMEVPMTTRHLAMFQRSFRLQIVFIFQNMHKRTKAAQLRTQIWLWNNLTTTRHWETRTALVFLQETLAINLPSWNPATHTLPHKWQTSHRNQVARTFRASFSPSQTSQLTTSAPAEPKKLLSQASQRGTR